MMKFFKSLMDGKDRANELHAFLVIVAFFALIFFEVLSIKDGNDFKAQEFGEAVGIILGGGGLAAIGQAILNKGS